MKLAAIVGPTASGKTALAVALATDFGLPIEVVSVDALQVYRQLDAGTAKPDAHERAAVPTHLLDMVDPTEPMHAARWAQAADTVIAEIVARGRWPVLVGGTGLYLRALLRGLADIPEVPQTLRTQLADAWEARGGHALWLELETLDPVYAHATPPQNRQRVLRALEVVRHTGRAFSAFHADHAAQPDRYQALTVVLDPPTDVRNTRIAARAAVMAPALLAEVAALRVSGLSADAPGLQAIGYRDAWARLNQDTPAGDFADDLRRAQQLYAKKQATWFRALPGVLRLAEPDGATVAAALRAWFAPE